jgi:hypothetical protein
MIKRETSRHPIATFNVPHGRPETVAAALAEFDRIRNEYGELVGLIEDKKAAMKEAGAADAQRLVDATLAGEAEPNGIGKAEVKLEAELDALAFKLSQVERALDISGDALAEQIGAAQTGWIERLEATRHEAMERYVVALTEAQAEADKLAKANGSLAWLRGWDTGRAIVGRIHPYHGGGRLDVVNNEPGPLRGEHQVSALLALAARAIEEPVVRGAGRSRRVVAGGASL